MALAASTLLAVPAAAGADAASPWAAEDMTRVRLVSASETAAAVDGAGPRLGLHFRMEKDWKVYWRSPGDAGYPPTIDWSGSQNLERAAVRWPAPERFSVLGFETLGYKDEVVLPVDVAVATPGEPLALRAKVDYLACAEICVPLTANLALDLPAGPAKASGHAHLVNRFAAKVPGPNGAQGLSVDSARADPQGGLLRVAATSKVPFQAPDVFVEGPPGMVFGPPEVTLSDDRTAATLAVPVDASLADVALAGSEVTLTLVDAGRGAEHTLEVGRGGAGTGLLGGLAGGAAAAAGAGAATGDAAPGLAVILGLAVLGGLILNLMPCVLPVLSLKLLGVVRHGGGPSGAVRLGFLASAAGILAAFMVLAGALVGLKLGGAAVGWGIQFQQPWFLVAMLVVVTLFAANLWGVFAVSLPAWIADAGERSAHVHGLGGHFLTGAFATLLATPCSAPFLGTAVGFALSRGPLEIVAVFAALALGLALPYLAVAAFPRVATVLPRPGPWMVWLCRVLGLALAATGVWLLTVLDNQVGVAGAVALGALMVALVAALALRRAAPRLGPAALAGAAAIAAAAFAVPSVVTVPPPAMAAAVGADGGPWTPFVRASIDELVDGGNVVLVDVTADWCITCQANKRFVLNADPVKGILEGDGVVAMQADWTRPDERISEYLAGFGRYGIPFNAVYGPGAPDGIPLPELLSADAVMSAIATARGGGTEVSRR